MTDLSVAPLNRIKTEIHVPGDKSISHRAVMIGSLAQGMTTVRGFLASADCLATIDCLKKLGVGIDLAGTKVEIKGSGLKGLEQTKELLDVGNSGTSIRLLSGILAGQPFLSKITGDESIQQRPMMRVVAPLREMGANIVGHSSKGNVFAPLEIHGGLLKPITYELPVASAQVKSAVLFAGLYADGETTVIERNQARDHTERMLLHFNAAIKLQGLRTKVRGNKDFEGAEVDVPGDISSAAFFMIAALMVPNSELLIKNVGVNPTRTGIIDVLHRMGARLEVMNEQLLAEEPRADILVKTSKLKAVRIDGQIIPRIIDEIPIIAVAATQAEGRTEIVGARELRVKESDRIATIAAELNKMGANVRELEDGLVIQGPTPLKAAEIDSHGDHRIAMSAAIAALVAEGETRINNTDCIETSFPGFSQLLSGLR